MASRLPVGVTDAFFEWPLLVCGIREAWALEPPPGGKRRGEGVVIAQPDTGYTAHPELVGDGRVLTEEGMNFFDGADFDPKDPLLGHFPFKFPNHGTGTASVMISAERDTAESASSSIDVIANTAARNLISGVAPLARLIPYRVSDTVLLNDDSDSRLALAIWHALTVKDRDPSMEVGVIGIAMGRPRLSVECNIRRALAQARHDGVIVCAAAGQAIGLLKPFFPGCDPNTICVAASDAEDERLGSGFYGEEVDLSAPGDPIWRALSERASRDDPSETYSIGTSWGTSHANAIVTGACAVWQAFHGRQNLIDIYTAPLLFDLFKKMVKDTCVVPPDWDTTRRGAGVLNVYNLLASPLPEPDELAEWIAATADAEKARKAPTNDEC